MIHATSYSRVALFEQCALRYQHQHIKKSVKDSGGPASDYGKRVHDALAARISDGKPLPQTMHRFEKYALKVLGTAGDKFTELQLAVDTDLLPSEWFARVTFIRAILDVLILNGNVAWVGDWKTGKVKDDDGQLGLFAAFVFTFYPEIETVNTTYLFLQDDHLISETYTREQLPDLWKAYLTRSQRIQEAINHDVWPARPSGLCGYCPVKKQMGCAYSD